MDRSKKIAKLAEIATLGGGGAYSAQPRHFRSGHMLYWKVFKSALNTHRVWKKCTFEAAPLKIETLANAKVCRVGHFMSRFIFVLLTAFINQFKRNFETMNVRNELPYNIAKIDLRVNRQCVSICKPPCKYIMQVHCLTVSFELINECITKAVKRTKRNIDL